MIDGIIKADGTSRLMRATLPATYEEFKAQAAAGTLPFDVLFNADGWSQLPTFLNKANLLKDSTASLFGFNADTVPDDVFASVSPAFRHWWSRWVPGTMSWQEVRAGTSWNVQINNKSYNYTWEYADAININQNDGTVSLINPTSITINYGQSESAVKSAFQKLKGKYCHSYDSLSDYILYFPNDADQHLSWGNNTLTVQAGHAYTVSSTYASTPVGDTTFLSSSNRNAYPDSGVTDGYEYSYLGVPWENARNPVRIATGSYTGAGTSGESNPNSLTFDFLPKIIFIYGHWGSGGNGGKTTTILIPSVGAYGGSQRDYDYVGKIIVSGNTVSWYATSGTFGGQGNQSGTVYTYIAIG